MGNTGSSAPAERAQETVRNVCLGGVALLFVGCLIAGLAWPHDVVQANASLLGSPRVVHKGSRGAVYLGCGIAGVGQALVLLAVIAWGVRLGVVSAESRDLSEADVQDQQGYVGRPVEPWTNPLAHPDGETAD